MHIAMTDVPNWIRIVLLIFSILSFIPQFHHTISRRNSSGISIFYILYNLVLWTEQFTLTFFVIVNWHDRSSFFVHVPVNTGDWINLAQATVVAILWLAFFLVCLWLPSSRQSSSTVLALSTYIAFLLASAIPVIVEAISPFSPEDRDWTMGLFIGIHLYYINYAVMGLAIAGCCHQLREGLVRPDNQALSYRGLVIQAFVFAGTAISWIWRINYAYERYGSPWSHFRRWFELVGWAAVGNAVFALGQAALLSTASPRTGSPESFQSAETEPLLNAHGLRSGFDRSDSM